MSEREEIDRLRAEMHALGRAMEWVCWVGAGGIALVFFLGLVAITC